MKIILAKNAGFCFGVRRAVELTEQTAAKVAESGSAAKVFTFGELIHNRDVVNRLREAGIAPIESLDEAQRGDYVIIRSHGVPKKIYEELETNIFPESVHLSFKNECGEYPTATSYAVWKAVNESVNCTTSTHILIYNHHHSINHSLILIRKSV